MNWEILTETKKIEIQQRLKDGSQKTVIKEVVVEKPEQIDEVGNIYQRDGGVVPYACQNCRKLFDGETQKIPIEENVPIYKCDTCSFSNAGADLAWDHEKANDGHKVKKESTKRLVGHNTIITGRIPRITITENDCIILCDDCCV